MLRKPYQENSQDISGLFFKKLVSKIPDLIFQLSLAPGGALSSSFLNGAVIKYFEISRIELRNFDLSQRILKDDFTDLLHSIQNLSDCSSNWTYEFRAMLPNKGLRWFKAVANVEVDNYNYKSLYGRLTDITEEKQNQIELKISEERFHFALDASNNGIWDIDLKTKKVFYSPQLKAMLDISSHDAIDSLEDRNNRIHKEDVDEDQLQCRLHFENVTPFYENTKRVLTNSGSYKWILSRGKVIERDVEDRPLRIIGTDMDITKQKIEEKKLLESIDIINEQNSRLLNFAHIVSHNLKSHTGNFKMLLDLADNENDISSLKQVHSYLRTSSNALNDTIEHLKQLVDINTDKSKRRESLNLKRYFNGVLDVLSEEISKNKVKILNNIPEECYINFNASYLESILLNFTTNAIKYAHPDRVPEINFVQNIENNKIALEIRDNGIGIDLAKNGDKIFGMYKTFHTNTDARGIGLFITKNQIRAMGGTVSVESQMNVGTTFKIFFNDEI